MSSLQDQEAAGPPYAPAIAGLGGVPTTDVDAPITCVLLFLYILGAATHMTILQLNLRRGHKFLASGALFGFCMARIVTCIMRLVWATHQQSVQIALAANIFVNAGVIIVIIINLLFAQRIIRASHPALGWHRVVHYLYIAYYVSIILMLVALITSIVQQSYTLDGNIRRIDHDIQLVGATYNAVAAFLPIPLILIGVVLPKLSASRRQLDKFGTGRFRTKVRILLLSSLLITLGAGFRTGTSYAPRPINDPAWYNGKAPFYVFNFVVEIIVIYLYAIVRIDRRFHVPSGSSKRLNYSTEDKPGEGATDTRIETDDEFLDDFRPDGKTRADGPEAQRQQEAEAERWEKAAEAEQGQGLQIPPATRAA